VWLGVRVPGYRSGGPGFDSRALQEKKKVVCLERGPLSLVSTTEELLGRNGSVSGLESREYGRRDSSRWLCSILYLQKVGSNFADKRRSLGRHSSLADWGHGVIFMRSDLGILYVLHTYIEIYSSIQFIMAEANELQCAATWYALINTDLVHKLSIQLSTMLGEFLDIL
jgi:hypothetical protein